MFNLFQKKKKMNIPNELKEEKQVLPLFNSIYDNIEYIKKSFVDTDDFIHRDLHEDGAVIYLEPLVDKDKVNQLCIEKVQSDQKAKGDIVEDLYKVIHYILEGRSIRLIPGRNHAIAFDTKSFENRSIEEPLNEKIISGSHEGFIEDLDTNIQILRRTIQNEQLKVKYMVLGRRSNTKVAMVYLQDLMNDEIIKELEYRLSFIDIDYIQAPGHIQELIEDEAFSPFPQMLSTERPDRVVANLMEGRFAIFTDRNPTSIIGPINFFAFFQTPDDYSHRWFIGSFISAFRLFSMIIAITLPGLYISIVSFHYEVVPFELIFTLKGNLEFVPFPPIIEAVSMQIILELLGEAATRLPSPIAQTIGVVGGLVIGTAIVEANLVSNTMIVVVALTAIASYAVPVNEMGTTLRILGFPIMFAASLLGFIGIIFVLVLILIHLCKLESFKTPYFSPLAPFHLKENKDTFVRFPIWAMKKRPSATKSKDAIRIRNSRGWKKDD
jgi:spore germination protein KA